MIIRAPRPTSHFTQVRNDVLRDRRLSFKARGLLAYLLSFPDSWRHRLDDLVKAGPDGRHSVTTALDELVAAHYIVRRRARHTDGTFTTRLVVFDTPQVPHRDTVDDMGTDTDSTADYPQRITGQSIEHSDMNTVKTVSTRNSRRTAPQLCKTCRGSGKVLLDPDDPADCHSCGGAGIR